jgi:hypothetical protein
MNSKLVILYQVLQSNWPKPPTKPGKPYYYNWPSMLLFFMLMLLKGIHSYKAMAGYAKAHYRYFGWQRAPSRKTIARRFEALPAVIYKLMPLLAQAASKLDIGLFRFGWVFIDKSVFRAKGGIWHRAHRLLGIVPHASIDTDASWAKSAYHGWRFGYGLHLVCNANRFPLACSVTTAASKDTTQLVPLLAHLVHAVGVVVADAGYIAFKLIKQLLQSWNVFLLLPYAFQVAQLTDWQKEYNLLAQTPQARLLYRQRKPSIEPVFALIKDLFHLAGESQLPFRGLTKVKPYLMMTAFSVQLMMYYNYVHQKDFATTQLFLTHFK